MSRIAFAGFMHETNTFAPGTTQYDAFDTESPFGAVLRGERLARFIKSDANIPVCGFTQSMAPEGHEIFPILFGFAEPSGTIKRACFERIMGEILDTLRQNGPFDGVYLDLHGAMVTEDYEDAESEILRRVET